MRRLFGACLALALAASAPAAELAPDPATTAYLGAAVLPQVSRILNDGAALLPLPEPDELTTPLGDGVAIRLHRAGRKPLRGSGSGRTLRDSFLAALDDLCRRQPAEARQVGTCRVTLSLWWRRGEAAPPDDGLAARVEPGLDGLELTLRDGRQLLLLPEDLMLRGLHARGRLDVAALRERLAPTLAAPLRVLTYTDAPGGFTALVRGAPPAPSLDESSLTRAALLAAGYLARSQGADGRFRYSYDAGRDTAGPRYNLVRHAGVCWALLRCARELAAPRAREAGVRGVAHVERVAERDGPRAYLLADDDSVVGATALSLLALLELPAQDLTPERRALARALGQGLLALQDGDGAFHRTRAEASAGGPAGPQPPYFPGEALLALTRLSRRDSGGPWRAAALRAARRQVRDHRGGGAACHWSAQGAAELGLALDSRPLMAAAATMARDLSAGQLRGDDAPGLGGAWPADQPPGACAAACRMEALGPAIVAAERAGEPWRELATALLLAASFVQTQQITPATEFLLPAPREARGGIRSSVVDYTIRMDVNQHALAGLLNARALLRRHPQLADLP